MAFANSYFEVQMLCSGAPCTTSKGYDLSCFDNIAHLYEILGVVTIECFKSCSMFHHNAVAIACIALRHGNGAAEGSINAIVGFRLDVYS